ncbi:hypothetical protein IPC139_00525 [Pseudomonas aeruginosa]|uniref:hypothetical protein n=2 Tax=Pseudomonas aeruginosa TaxID=287 RepID=UPI000ACB4F5E|nr:hypothetical protein [Pseudomonas aeruginosa]MBO2823311.1 hypothetical protein [Pseudomonas aeruginosa]MBW6227386.1 hypothetical protein [Pseudomonas aeruginosa]MBW6364710.1 hypothetical protein [Pseudomonas aeruginosa]MCO5622517.1 hypothetical protein [Pseudomonas aeruginosa]MCT5380661.1 hypothetical protein [Pseudomonas aeruginosa]
MDAKNLVVLMQLKKAMQESAQKERGAHIPGQGFSEESEEVFRELARRNLSRSKSQKDSDSIFRPAKHDSTAIETRVTEVVKSERDRALHQQNNKRERNPTFRGVEVPPKYYRALVDAASSFSTRDKLIKMEALAYYLEKAPDDKGALNMFARISALEDPKPSKRPRKAYKEKGSRVKAPLDIEKIKYSNCEVCQERLIVTEFRKPSARVLCGKCRAEMDGRKNKSKLRIVDESVTNKKIAQLEKSIAAMKKQIEESGGDLSRPRPGLAKLERALEIERLHAVSGLSKLRCKIVPGSYGAGKRT